MKRRISILLLLFVLVGESFACLNYYYFVNKDGNYYSSDNIIPGFNINFNLERNVSNLKKSSAALTKQHDYKSLSDYSVSLLKLGKTKTALDILVALEKAYPTEYNLAANLGTAYELSGMPDSALKYIQLALKINPNSHSASEWIHVKILETKLKLRSDKNYLDDHSVLLLSETQKKDTMIRMQIEWQARERFPFSKAPDPIMSSIMSDLGDLYCEQLSVEYGKAMYQIAQHCFGDTTKLVKQRIKESQKYIDKYKDKQIPIPIPKRMEASYQKIGYFSYKQLLDDNDQLHYVVNWAEIDLNVKNLLSKAKII